MTISDEELAAIKAQAVEEFLAEAERDDLFKGIYRAGEESRLALRREKYASNHEWREALLEKQRSPEYRERCRNIDRLRYQEDPEFRRKKIENARKQHEKKRQRMLGDPEYAKQVREKEAARMRKLREKRGQPPVNLRLTDEEKWQRKLKWQREYRARKKAERDERQTDND